MQRAPRHHIASEYQRHAFREIDDGVTASCFWFFVFYVASAFGIVAAIGWSLA